MVLEHPCSSKYLAYFWLKTLTDCRKIHRAQAKKSATSIFVLDPPKEDGGVFCDLSFIAPKAHISQSAFGLD